MKRESDTNEACGNALTLWDKVNAARWGQYLIKTEKELILKGQAVAGPPASAVDLGCGSGQWSELLSTLGWSMTCVDIDQSALDICMRRVPSAVCKLADPTTKTIPYESNMARLLLSIEVVVLQEEWFPREVARVLAEEGVWIGVFWNGFSWRNLAWRLKNLLRHGNDSAPSFYRTSYYRWRKGLAATGFEMVYEKGFCWAPFGRDSNSPLIPVLTRLEKILFLDRWVLCSPWVIFVARKKAGGHL